MCHTRTGTLHTTAAASPLGWQPTAQVGWQLHCLLCARPCSCWLMAPSGSRCFNHRAWTYQAMPAWQGHCRCLAGHTVRALLLLTLRLGTAAAACHTFELSHVGALTNSTTGCIHSHHLQSLCYTFNAHRGHEATTFCPQLLIAGKVPNNGVALARR